MDDTVLHVEATDPRPFAATSHGEADGLRGDDAFVVVVGDPVTGELDCYGPYDLRVAEREARRLRGEFDVADLPEVVVTVARCSDAPPGR
jgi:hypothetical protein